MKNYPGRLAHHTPGWVDNTSLFHVRIRADSHQQLALTDPALAGNILAAAQRYHELGRWNCVLFLLMPDHIHALLSFASPADLPVVLRNWKRGTTRFQGIQWQDNFFDHRIRTSKEGNEAWHYIRRNPVAKNLCEREEAWAWWWSGVWGKEERMDSNGGK